MKWFDKKTVWIAGLLIGAIALSGLGALLISEEPLARDNVAPTSRPIFRNTVVATPQPVTTGPVPQATTPPRSPEVPMMRIRYRGEVYDGLQGSGCWQSLNLDGSVSGLCWDVAFVDPPAVIPVTAGSTLTIEVEAHEPPETLWVQVITSVSDESPTQISLEPSLAASYSVDLPAGVYIIHIYGGWSEGSVFYTFKLEVR